MYDWLILPIELPPSMAGGTQQPTFRSGVDCPSSVVSAIRSCPELAAWFVIVALGGIALGYWARR